MTHLTRGTGTLLAVVAIEWRQITGGSLLNAIILAGTILGVAVFAFRTFNKEKTTADDRNAAAQAQAIDAYKGLYEATLVELETTRGQRDAYQDASDQARNEISDMRARIATLEAQPDTEHMLRVQNENHAEILKGLQGITRVLEDLLHHMPKRERDLP